MKVIKKMYQCCAQPSENSMKSDKVYCRAKNRVNQHYTSLCQKLSGKDIEILDAILLEFDTKMERRSMHCFEAGFKTGVAIAMEALDFNLE